jgi:hypothetical protein
MQKTFQRPKGKMVVNLSRVSFGKQEQRAKNRKNSSKSSKWFLDLSQKDTFEKLLTSDASSTDGNCC